MITTLTYEPIGVGVPAGDPLLVNWVENFMGIAEQTGLLEGIKGKMVAAGGLVAPAAHNPVFQKTGC